MATGETLKNMAIGAGIFALGYHFLLRPRFPSLPALNVNELNNIKLQNQQLIQENSLLRNKTNEAFMKLADTPEVVERQRRFGAMPFQQHPVILDRERRFGFMSDTIMPVSNTVKSFGMLY